MTNRNKTNFSPFVERIANFFIEELKLHIPLFKIDWADAKQRLDAMPTLSKNAMNLALSKGWFFGWHDSLEDVLLLVEELSRVPEKLDEIMVQYHRKKLDFVENELVRCYPKRLKPIEAAFTAHKNLGEIGYFLSIPVFIAQTDGILTEITKVESPMSTRKTKGQRKEINAADTLRNRIGSKTELHDLLQPLLIIKQSDFLKSSAERNKTSVDVLNRHQVMHGESCDYGNEINSLKALSLLAFVGIHLPMVLEEG